MTSLVTAECAYSNVIFFFFFFALVKEATKHNKVSRNGQNTRVSSVECSVFQFFSGIIVITLAQDQ